MRINKQKFIANAQNLDELDENFEETKEGHFCRKAALHHLMQSDEWGHHDFTQELNGDFDEGACINEVNEREALAREDALLLEDVMVTEGIHKDFVNTHNFCDE